MEIAVFGLGYVGCVSSACLAQLGHNVVGVDVSLEKVNAVLAGSAPFYEPGLDELIREQRACGRLHATPDAGEALARAEVALVCVGTPSSPNGGVDTSHLRRLLTGLHAGLRPVPALPLTVLLRSTVLPAALRALLDRVHAEIGKPAWSLVVNPEFLRQGSALDDFRHPPFTILGGGDPAALDRAQQLYSGLDAPLVRTDAATASLIKYACNAWHALKVDFANEVGELAGSLAADGAEAMRVVCQDTKLNISARYLRPGFAFGGSCLPKDVRALVTHTRAEGQRLPLLESVLPSNHEHLQRCVHRVLATGRRQVALLGLSFKAGTDDLRESPAVLLAEALLGKGLNLRVWEPHIARPRLFGANLQYLERSLPHIWELLGDKLEPILAKSDLVVVTRPLEESELAALRLMPATALCLDLSGTLRPEAVPGGLLKSTVAPPPLPQMAAIAD
ncbi:MAG: nucleotide sugar dehydrogenase [Terriglobales bacterium]